MSLDSKWSLPSATMLNVDEIWNVHDDKEEDENVLQTFA